MAQYVANVPIKFKSISVPTSAPVLHDMQSFPVPSTVRAIPGASGTLKVEYSLTPNAAGNAAAATWVIWPAGTVSATADDSLTSPIAALRFTATTSTGTVEISC